MEKICPICGKAGALSIASDPQLRARFEFKTPTKWGLCEDHQKLHDDGFIALIEVDPTKSVFGAIASPTIKHEAACRTGLILHMKREVALEIFGLGTAIDLPLIFVDIGVISGVNEQVNDLATRQMNQKLMDQSIKEMNRGTSQTAHSERLTGPGAVDVSEVEESRSDVPASGGTSDTGHVEVQECGQETLGTSAQPGDSH